MNELLNRYPLHFPARHDPSTTLQHFLNDLQIKADLKNRLPTIVRITSLNNHGKWVKGFLTKNSSLLLIKVDHIDSILAEYHTVPESRNHSHRYRFNYNQSKISTKATSKFLNMKKLSRSLVSLSGSSVPDVPHEDEEDLAEGSDEFNAYQKNLVKSLNEKLPPLSSSISPCRIPLRHRAVFELLNESDTAMKLCETLADLMVKEYDENDENVPKRSIERWPHAFLLRSPCAAYTRKTGTDSFNSTSCTNELKPDDQSSATSTDSCYGSSAELDGQKHAILLNDEPSILQARQIITILDKCTGLRGRTWNKNSNSTDPSASSAPSSPATASPSLGTSSAKARWSFSWFRKPRPSQLIESSVPDHFTNRSTPGKVETYLKCRTEQGDIVYISVHESGLFSPFNGQTHRLKLDNRSNDLNLSASFAVKDLLTSFRFPVSVRYVDTQVSFENIYAPAVINPVEPQTSLATKFRLLGPFDERVVFACPLHSVSTKAQKNPAPLLVIPIPADADILIQPCINMEEISTNELFQRLVESCHQVIEQYQTEISLIHFPLSLFKMSTTRKKTALNKKRSHSESQIDGYFEEESNTALRQSDEYLSSRQYFSQSSPQRYGTGSPNYPVVRTTKSRAFLLDGTRSPRRSYTPAYHGKQSEYRRSTLNHSDSDDDMYRDVDRIYDYIRSGHATTEVKKILEKELANHRTAQGIDIPSSNSPIIHVCCYSIDMEIVDDSDLI